MKNYLFRGWTNGFEKPTYHPFVSDIELNPMENYWEIKKFYNDSQLGSTCPETF